MRKWALILTVIGCVAVVAASIPTVRRADVAYRVAQMPVILVDAGHGGFDGGTTGVDGTQEKAVNLAVSRTLATLLRVLGFEVREVRVDDSAIFSDGATSVREKKVSDLHNRLALYEQATLVVSIHQNQFSQSKYNGAQVFYGQKNEQSKPLAAAIRAEVLALLQPENTRELKRGDNGIYLLANATVPVALVECGFLSNPDECRKLATADYQRQMALAVAGGVVRFLGGGDAPLPAE